MGCSSSISAGSGLFIAKLSQIPKQNIQVNHLDFIGQQISSISQCESQAFQNSNQKLTENNLNMINKNQTENKDQPQQISENQLTSNDKQIIEPKCAQPSDQTIHLGYIDEGVIQLIASLKAFIINQPALNCLLSKQCVLKKLQLFEEFYVDEYSCISLIEFILKLIEDSIIYVNQRKKTSIKSQYFNQQIIGHKEYIQNVAKTYFKIGFNIFSINKFALSNISYASEFDKKNKKKISYNELSFDFSEEQANILVTHLQKFNYFEQNQFAYLSNYLLQCCLNMEKNDANCTVFDINTKLCATIEMLIKNYPVDKIELSKSLVGVIKSFKQEIGNISESVDFTNVPVNKREQFLLMFIDKKIEQSHQIFLVFLEIVQQICFLLNGYKFRAQFLLQNLSNQRKIEIIKENLFCQQFKKYNLTSLFDKKLNDLFFAQQNHYKQEINKIFESSIKFNISMINGSCKFKQIEEINKCVLQIMIKIKQKQKEGTNCKLIEVINRLQQNTCDIILKIQINETICEFQLRFDQINLTFYLFNQNLKQILSSKFITPLSMLKRMNNQISNQFFGKIMLVNQANINLKNRSVYYQRITFNMVDSFLPHFIKSLPSSILKRNNKISSKIIAQLNNKLNCLKSIKIKRSNLSRLNEDIKQINQFFDEYLYNCNILMLENAQNYIIKNNSQFLVKLKEQKWSQITQKYQQNAEQYSVLLNQYGKVNFAWNNYQKAISYFKINEVIQSQTVLNNKQKYSQALFNISKSYNELNNLEKFKQYLYKFIKISPFDQTHSEYINAFKKLIQIQQNHENYQAVLQLYQLQLDHQQKIKGKGCIESIGTLFNIGIIHQKKGDIFQAAKYYQYTIQIEQQHNVQTLDYALHNLKLGICLFHNFKDYASVIPYFVSAELIYLHFIKNQNLLQYYQCLEYLFICYQKTNNMDKVNEYQKKRTYNF